MDPAHSIAAEGDTRTGVHRSVEWGLVVDGSTSVVGDAGCTAVGYTAGRGHTAVDYTAGHGHTASVGAGVGTAVTGSTSAVVQSWEYIQNLKLYKIIIYIRHYYNIWPILIY